MTQLRAAFDEQVRRHPEYDALLVAGDFAGLWGGGTLPAWRGRGVFRSVIAHRTRLARERAFSHLFVDASAQSRPILERLGFVALAKTTPFTHPGSEQGGERRDDPGWLARGRA
jgi:GNAT superfamily N-acetyltransferase